MLCYLTTVIINHNYLLFCIAKRNRWDKMEEEPPKKKSAWDQADVSFQ
jgi:hypothetical protein